MKLKFKFYQSYLKTSLVGLEVGLSVGVGVLGGYWLDQHYHYSPYGLIFGALVGSIAALKRLWLFTKSYLDKNDSNHE